MKDRSPCISCKHRYPGCQCRCEIGKKYWAKDRERRDKIRAAVTAEGLVDRTKFERIQESKRKAGLE